MNLSQVLSEIKSSKDRSPFLSTGSVELDRILVQPESESRNKRPKLSYGGQVEHGNCLKRGSVVELCGPPGSGKTFVSLNLAKEALLRGHQVVWISCCHKVVPITRLGALLKTELDGDESNVRRTLKSFLVLNCESLAKLVVVLRRLASSNGNDLSRLALIVIDDLSFLVESSYSPGTGNLNILERRRDAINGVCTVMSAVAKRRYCAVVAVSYAISRRGVQGVATLVSCLGYGQLEKWFTSRIMLYRGNDGERLGKSLASGEFVKVDIKNLGNVMLLHGEQPFATRGILNNKKGNCVVKEEEHCNMVDDPSSIVEPQSEVSSSRELSTNQQALQKPLPTSDGHEGEVDNVCYEPEKNVSEEIVAGDLNDDNRDSCLNDEKVISVADVSVFSEVQDSQAWYDELSEEDST